MSLQQTEMSMVELLLERANDAQRDFIFEKLSSLRSVVKPAKNSNEGPLRVGDRVIFIGRKTKPKVIGTIKSMNAKTYTIADCSDGGPGWRMPPSMLTRYCG